MDGTSLTPEQEKLNALRQVLPEVFAEGKVDWEKLKATLGEDINFANERYVLNWAGKSDAFKVLQTPTTKTLVPAKDESINFDETENIFIEGENLEVLKVLQKSYFGKVKMIYIDPPYNTGNDSFIYPDKFSETKAEYEKRVGDKDEDGYMTKDGMFKKNSKENGQYHSNWLNMMMPRLYLAKNLLTQDGVIFVSIDDNEVHNLRLLLNEVFGEENFVVEFIWKKGKELEANNVGYHHEYILLYAKNKFFMNLELQEKDLSRHKSKLPEINLVDGIESIYKEGEPFQLINLSKQDDYNLEIPLINGEILKRKGYLSPDTLKNFIKTGRIFVGKKKTVYVKSFLSDERNGSVVSSIIESEFGTTKKGGIEQKDYFGFKPFSYPKPTLLLKHILKTVNKDAIILDFFAGSGTTADAVIQLNTQDGGHRKYICVQLPELTEEKSEAYKAGYKTIADISKERIRRAGKKIAQEIQEEIAKKEALILKLESEIPTEENRKEIETLKAQILNLQSQDLGFKVLKLDDSNFKQWKQIEGKDAKALAEQIKLFVDPVSESATIENMVYELLLKSGKDLNSRIEKNDSFYKINNSELILLLEKATQEVIDAVIAETPIKVIALDKVFKENDQLKTNTVLQMQDAGIEFKTI